MATTAAAAKAPADIAPEAPKTKSKKKLLLIIVLALVVLSAGGAAAWFFLVPADAEADAAPPPVSSKPPVFMPVDQFTVNLQADDGQQFLQTAMTLKLADQETADAIKTQMPEVRSRVLLLLSSKKASQLMTLEGKAKLAEEIKHEVEAPLPVDKTRAKDKAAKKKAKADGDDAKSGKKAKAKAKAEAGVGAQAGTAAAPAETAPQRVLAVYFTHFIIQ
ncbi:MAG: flagellar basal body-associated protein FliL [Burkholderiales bacterium]|nr:flagellar basal body-associated protein FliL [Burkholderiales bacterium]